MTPVASEAAPLPPEDLTELIMRELGSNVASVSEALRVCVARKSLSVPLVARADLTWLAPSGLGRGSAERVLRTGRPCFLLLLKLDCTYMALTHWKYPASMVT